MKVLNIICKIYKIDFLLYTHVVYILIAPYVDIDLKEYH